MLPPGGGSGAGRGTVRSPARVPLRPTMAASDAVLEGFVTEGQDDGRRPFDEALLDTRTPAEFAVAPDGRTLAFALLSTVDDVGRHFPSELWLGGIEQSPTRLTGGHAPAW